MSRPMILPADIFVETINILGKRSGHEIAPYLSKALEKFKVQAPAVSLTDCMVMAVADAYGTKDIFGFDMQYVKAGYHRLEPATEWKQSA